MNNINSALLGETPTRFTLDSREATRDVIAAMTGQARRSLAVFTPDLNKFLYDQQAFVDAVRQLVTSRRGALIRVLVKDSSRAAAEGHRLINLAQRLSSFIHFRTPPEDYAEYHEAFLIADTSGVVHQAQADRFKGWACFHAPLEARRLRTFFDEVWQNSAPDSRLRRLSV
ncbi:MAG TPA: hypothetical protein ENJ19_11465 [Gammaproteobacteria bacterium]|nr:hypothetical protein [Gammaproteobacteria bacterium]